MGQLKLNYIDEAKKPDENKKAEETKPAEEKKEVEAEGLNTTEEK